jgi:hypothetical protein
MLNDSYFNADALKALFLEPLAPYASRVGPVIFEYEPVAAAYFYENNLDHDELILIGDFGGGTSDFSLLRVGPRYRRSPNRILGTEGIALAGDAFDARVVRNLISLKLGRTSEYRALNKVLPMPEWIYSDLERWHYLSFLKSNDTIQMIRSIQAFVRTREDQCTPPHRARRSRVLSSSLGTANEGGASSELAGAFDFEDTYFRCVDK